MRNRISDFDRHHRTMGRVFCGVFGATLVLVVSIWAFVIFMGVKMFMAADLVVKEVGETGARSVIERLWCGKSTDCELYNSGERK